MPSSSFKASTVSGAAVGPRMFRATSPGITSQATKTMTLRSQSVTRASPIRRRRKLTHGGGTS